MKMFCRICGNELNEQAVICTKCGCAVDNKNLRKDDKAMNKIKENNYLVH